MKKVSVIVPVYNAEKYLKKCLDSLQSQTIDSIEIICVNDGSTDGSRKILEEYSSDARFTIIDKANSGYGASVNLGFERACGEYIGIVESDDYVDKHMYEDLYAATQSGSADLVKSAFYYYSEIRGKERKEKCHFIKALSPIHNPTTLSQTPDFLYFHPSVWSCIYKKTFLTENNIRFIETKGAGWSDNPFFIRSLYVAKSIVWVPKCYYYYRQDNPSASSVLYTLDYRVPLLRALEMHDVLDEMNVPSDSILRTLQYNRDLNYIALAFRAKGDLLSKMPLTKELLSRTDPNNIDKSKLSNVSLPKIRKFAESYEPGDLFKQDRSLWTLCRNFVRQIRLYGFSATFLRIKNRFLFELPAAKRFAPDRI